MMRQVPLGSGFRVLGLGFTYDATGPPPVQLGNLRFILLHRRHGSVHEENVPLVFVHVRA